MIIKDYGGCVTIKELDKIKLADYICGLDTDKQRVILANLKTMIDRICIRVNGDKYQNEAL